MGAESGVMGRMGARALEEGARGAAEGAIYGAGQTVSEVALGETPDIRADRLLTSFRRNGTGVRVVVDEFGAFVGVIGPDAVLAVLAGWWRRPAALQEPGG
jgi:hypothetical protein